MHAKWRVFRRFDFRDQVAGRCLPARECDTCRLAHDAPAAVTSDQVLRTENGTIGDVHVDAVFVLREARHVPFAIERYGQLRDPSGHDALDVILPEREPVIVTRGKVADVETGHRVARDLKNLSFGEEAVHDPTLVEHFERARGDSARA